jgi:hypothetical protein
MRIQLKQSDIETALKAYIAAQGINVAGKEITITFSAIRKGGPAVAADLDIHDAPSIPAMQEAVVPVTPAVDPAPAATDPAPVLKAETPAGDALTELLTDPPAPAATLVDPEPETEYVAPANEPVDDAPQEAVVETKTTSLFGN